MSLIPVRAGPGNPGFSSEASLGALLETRAMTLRLHGRLASDLYLPVQPKMLSAESEGWRAGPEAAWLFLCEVRSHDLRL